MKNKIWNISSSLGFAEILAQRFLDEYAGRLPELAEVLFLLPNRRAVRAMKEAFVRLRGLTPMLLPRMMPLGEVEEDELFLTGGSGREFLDGMYPAIGTTERLLLFIKIIMAKPTEFGMEKMTLGQACFLAQELASLIDMVNNEQLSFGKLEQLVPEDYAAHWQETLKFLKIITHYWPQILAERKLIDASERRNRLLTAQAEIWKRNKPRQRIVVAGTTAAFPAMKELVKTVLELPSGEVYLAGLDKSLSEEDWAEIDETHPQFELKELLDYLKLERAGVAEAAEPANPEAEAFIAEVMRPAGVSDKWLDLPRRGFSPQAWGGISLVNCTDIREEALGIALIMREALEEEGKTAALVTSDRNLARRVANELERWNIQVDDSAGRPLSFSAAGIFLRQILQAATGDKKLFWAELLKNPLCCLGREYGEIRRLVRQLEKKVWRQQREDSEAAAFENDVRGALSELSVLLHGDRVDFKQLLACHIRTAEKLASRGDKSGEQVLWGGDDGEAAARFAADLYEQAEVLGEINSAEYAGLLEAMMVSVNVRPKFGMHPRLKILGPIEARLNRFDVTIIGEANEGIWPQAPGADPWMSRPMKKEFGFPLPERAVGVNAFDFSQLLAGDEVYLTRAERVQGTPMVKSRWWLRLETVLKALNLEPQSLENAVYRLWARHLDRPEQPERLSPPQPRPPLEARPQELSASAIELWMRDPYSVYAKYILKLKPLEELDRELTPADYGTIIHAVLQQFNNKYPQQLPENAKAELLKLGEAYFEQNQIAAETRAFWWPNFLKSVDWILEREKAYRPGIRRVYNEVRGSAEIKTARGFCVTAIADRVDETTEGRYNIIDYKTGRARSEKEVRGGYAPQLPIEGLIARAGGFGNLPAREVDKLIYWQLARQETEISGETDKLLDDTYERLQKLVSLFEFETTAYVCQPNPKRIPEYSDYEHLARVREWSVVGDENEG